MKKLKALTMLSLLAILAGCQGTSAPDSTPEQKTSDASSEQSYPSVVLIAKTYAKEVEVGQSIDVIGIVSTDKGVDTTCEFSVSDTSKATIAKVEGSKSKAKLTGVAPGSVTVTVTSVANPNVSSTITVTVIATRPDLRTIIKNIHELDSYTLEIEKIDATGEETSLGDVFVMPDMIVYSNNGSAVLSENNVDYYGEMVTDDGKVVYITEKGSVFQKEEAPIIQCNAGLLSKDNFRGLKDKTIEPFQVGKFYSLDTINPEWVTDVKNDDNTYVIEGEAEDENHVPVNINAAFLECQLWKMMDSEGYQKNTNQGEYYFELADKVMTTIYAESSNQIRATVELGDIMYQMTMTDIGSTESDLEMNDFKTEFEGVRAAAPLQNEKFKKGIAALADNNFVQNNVLYPDHQTAVTYNTYYTPDYVFMDSDTTFKEEYNRLVTEGDDKWTEAPHGFVKKADGVYAFKYDETNNTITIGDKEDATDASTKLAVQQNYFSSLPFLSNDLQYSFDTVETGMWHDHSETYFPSDSREVYDELSNYYFISDEDDDPSIIEGTKSGLGIELNADGSVSQINVTAGATPFDNDFSDHQYGVYRFSLTSFGNATKNKVDTLLKEYINK